MLIDAANIKLYLRFWDNQIEPAKTPVIFLHGFTGSSGDWNFLLDKLPANFLPVAIDLIGHGKSESTEEESYYSASALVSQLKSLVGHFKFDNVILAGYSMGGRLALSFAVKYPNLVKGLILESSSPGILVEEERQKRIKSDTQLIEIIKTEGIEKFIDQWVNHPILNSYKNISKESFENILADKKKNNPIGLINSLNGFGTGVMPEMWSVLETIRCETLLITGESDEKFTRLNRKMDEIISCSEHKIIAGCGHITHLEKPQEFVILICSFLNALKQSNGLT